MSKEIFDIVIVSAGKSAREVYSWAQHCIQAGQPWRVKGFLDNRTKILDGFEYPAPILAGVESYHPAADDRFLCAIGEPRMKKKYTDILLARGARFVNLIHPTAVMGEHVRLGQGVILAPYSALTCDLSIGNFVTISTSSGAGHDTVIGDYCQISGNCGINGNAVLHEGVFLGSHSAILPNVVIGAWAYVGAGSVVLKRVKPGVKVFGNPAVPIGMVEESVT